jgi:glucosamine kinase
VIKVHLGLDVGGTASRWVACDTAGEIVARGSVGGATAHVFNPAEKDRLTAVMVQLAQAVANAKLEVLSLTGGLTGFGPAAALDICELTAGALGIEPNSILVMDDIILAYAALFQPGEGHLVSAGTGSIGVHVGETGKVVRVGGRGILIDDAGSGSWIALQALDQIYRAWDHSGSFGNVEKLARHVFAKVGGQDWQDVRQFIYAGDRGRIGTLAVAVADAALESDATALGILRKAAIELSRLAKALQARAGSGPVAIIGGVLRLHPVIAADIAQHLSGTQIIRPQIDSALAAARLRLGDAGAKWHALLSQDSFGP